MKYHYVYKITNKNSGMMYRSSVVEPSKDIGIEYFSSSVDKEFKSDQRNNPSDYAYEVIETFNCRGDASNFEIKLHNEFNVSKNPLFYNRAKATTTGFCVHGLKHSDETRKKISDARKGIPQKTGQCPYCLKVCSLGNLSRWHLDNCKLNPISLQQPMLAVDN